VDGNRRLSFLHCVDVQTSNEARLRPLFNTSTLPPELKAIVAREDQLFVLLEDIEYYCG
jgi:hypothetical protein